MSTNFLITRAIQHPTIPAVSLEISDTRKGYRFRLRDYRSKTVTDWAGFTSPVYLKIQEEYIIAVTPCFGGGELERFISVDELISLLCVSSTVSA